MNLALIISLNNVCLIYILKYNVFINKYASYCINIKWTLEKFNDNFIFIQVFNNL